METETAAFTELPDEYPVFIENTLSLRVTRWEGLVAYELFGITATVPIGTSLSTALAELGKKIDQELRPLLQVSEDLLSEDGRSRKAKLVQVLGTRMV